MASEAHSGKYLDSTTGQQLKPELVKLARALEMDYFTNKKVYTKVPREESYERMGKAPISVKWVDVNKGDDQQPNYRSRLVARERRRLYLRANTATRGAADGPHAGQHSRLVDREPRRSRR